MPQKRLKPQTTQTPVHKNTAPAWQSDPVVIGLGVLVLVVVLWLLSRLFKKKPKQSNYTPVPLPESRRLGDYMIREQIANGGTATVYRGEDVGLNPVAVKIPHAEQLGNRVFAATFLREAQIGLELRHPSIVRVLQASSYKVKGFKQIPYFVMEYLEGQELAEYIARNGPLDPQFAIMVARSVADALQWAHTRGVIHRDISPNNIFITSKRLVKVMDFGISTVSARFSGGKQSKALNFGTPDYLAPERILDSRSRDSRSDLYSLGCVVFEMIAGIPPYYDENPGIVIQRQVKAPVPSLREKTQKPIDWGIEDFTQKLMAKNPKDRYQTAGEVVSALAELIEEK